MFGRAVTEFPHRAFLVRESSEYHGQILISKSFLSVKNPGNSSDFFLKNIRLNRRQMIIFEIFDF